MADQYPLSIFCGYAHEDRAFFQQLKDRLAVLLRQGVIRIWHHEDILPGSQWEDEIERELNIADIILLFVTPNFIDSEYCWSKEMQWAITRNTAGDARVVPIFCRPTPNWEETPLGALQALPKGGKPITSWNKRDDAFSNVADELHKVVRQMQQEGRYPVKEYTLELQPSVYVSGQDDILAQEAARHRGEQWLEDIAPIGILQQITEDDQHKAYRIMSHEQMAHITMYWNYAGIDRYKFRFRSANIILTSQYPAFLDQVIRAGTLPYRVIQWSLHNDLDVPALARGISERAGKVYQSASQVIGMQQEIQSDHVEYLLTRDEYQYNENPLRITFSSKGPVRPDDTPLPARVCLIHENLPFSGFYQAHKLFSVQKLLLMLRGEIPHMKYWQLIEDACKPEPDPLL